MCCAIVVARWPNRFFLLKYVCYSWNIRCRWVKSKSMQQFFIHACGKCLSAFHSILPLQLTFVLLFDFVQVFSHSVKLFNSFPLDFCCCWYGHTASIVDVVACDNGVVFVVVVLISLWFVDSSSFSGSPFRFTTFISTSTPCSFDATDYFDNIRFCYGFIIWKKKMRIEERNKGCQLHWNDIIQIETK